VVTEPARTPWVDQARIEREGIAIVCPEVETPCLQEQKVYGARYGAKVDEVTLARSYFGTPDTPMQYRIAIIPPR
jgi:hypothetical protein